MNKQEKRTSQHNGIITWMPCCKLSESLSDAHGAHRDGPHPTNHPSSDRQRHIRQIYQ